MRVTGTLFPNAKRTIILASAGAGKGLPVTSKILTRNGFIQLKDLRLYDKVISPVDGKEYPVTGIYNRGYRHVNRITFTNRTSVLFDDDHLWAIQSDVDRLNGSGFTVVNANELKSLPLKRKAGKWNKHLVFVPVSCPVEFSDKILPIPYALGLFISDGCFTNKSIVLAEEDVKQKFENEIGTCGSYLKPLKKKYNYYISKFSRFKTILPSFGTHSYNKFIPKEYLYSSLDTRRKLLSGLIDGDGMVTRSGKIEFVSTSKQLIDDITFLVSSLGGVVAKGKEKVGKYTKNGSVVLCRKAYRISFWLPEGVLLSAKHQTRLSLCTKQRHPYKAVESIEDAGYAECMCIYIDSPDHLFITDDWIVTHNTSRLMSILGEYLVTMDSSRISFVTFTRKGVAEGVSRVLQKYTFLTYDQLPFFRTLHSLCFKELKLDYKNLWGIRHEKLLNASIGSNVHRFYDDEHSTRDNQILDAYDIERSGGRADPYITCSPEYARLVSAYERVKEETGAIDFTDCLKLFVEKGKPLPVDVACVDECQDLTDLQWDVCNIAFANASKVYCAGDDFQSVFTYAGANPQVLIDLARVSKVEKLEISHRLPVTVYNLARKITNNIEVKIDKDCRPKEGAKKGAVKFLPDLFSLYPFIKGKAEEDWYILTRNTAFQKDVISFLEGLVLPYIANDRYFIPALDWRKLKDFYLFKKEGYKTEEKKLSFMQENGIKNINCALIETTLFSPAKNTLYQAYVDMYGWEKIEEWYEKKTGIIVSNIHRVKGGEADNVVVVLDCGKKVAEHAFDMPDDELRTLYVAVTRAKENLFFIRSQSNDALDKLLTRCINS